MKFCTALMLLASAGNLATILSLPLVDDSGGFNNEGFAKRQNQQALALVMSSLTGIANQLNHELVTRANFTQRFVATLWSNNPNYNYVICHVAHDYSFQGKQGVDWDHQKVDTSSTITFDIIVGGAGEFILNGEGGYINWAYVGAVKSRTEVGSDTVIDFNAP